VILILFLRSLYISCRWLCSIEFALFSEMEQAKCGMFVLQMFFDNCSLVHTFNTKPVLDFSVGNPKVVEVAFGCSSVDND
jgi:hypothetical protein